MAVLVTRPAGQANGLIAGLQDHGLAVEHIPALEIVQPPQAADLSLLDKHYDYVFFISPAAVASLPVAAGVDEANLVSLQKAQIYAPGRGTAAAVKKRWCLNCAYPTQASGAEALLALPSLRLQPGQSALIVRGVGGNPLLREQLQQANLQVSELITYKRQAAKAIHEQLPAWLASHQPQDRLAIVTSVTALDGLLAELNGAARAQFQQVPLVVASERMVKRAEQAAWRAPIYRADTANDAELIEAVLRVRSRK